MSTIQGGTSPAGVTGVIAMPGTVGVEFPVIPYFWRISRDGVLRERFGISDPTTLASVLDYRQIKRIGNGTCLVTIPIDEANPVPPEPAAWKGKQTTYTVQAGAKRDGTLLTATYTIIIEGFSNRSAVKESYDQATGEFWKAAITFRVVGDPVYSDGWGSQIAAEVPTHSDLRLYENTHFIYDADTLDSSEILYIDWYNAGITTDAALKTLLLAEIAAFVTANTTPFVDNLKPNPSRVNMDAPDGGTVILDYRLTTPAERILNDATERSVDPSALQSRESTAAFNTTPGSAVTSGLVARSNIFREYNDNMVLQVKNWGPTTTEEDLTFPGTPTTTDKSTIPIRSSRSETVVTGVNTEPSFTPGGNLKNNSWFKQQLTDAGKWLHRHLARLTTPQEDVENQSSVRHYDVSGLDDYEVRGKVLASVTTTDAGSSADTTLSQQGADITEINDNAIHHRYRWGKLTPAEQIQHGSNTRFNPADDLTGTTTVTDLITVATVTSTDSTAVIEAARRSSLLSDKRFVRTNVIKRNKVRAIYRDTYRNDDFQVAVSGMHTNREQRPTDATGAYVNITRVRAVTASLNEILLQPFDVTVTRGTVVLTRLFSTNSIITGHYQGALLGYTNAALFLGFGIGSLMYMGPQLIFNLTDTGTINSSTGVISGSATAVPVGFRYVYAFSSIGHFSQSTIAIGTWYPTTASVSVGTGTAATSIDAGWAPQGLGTGDFKEFLKG